MANYGFLLFWNLRPRTIQRATTLDISHRTCYNTRYSATRKGEIMATTRTKPRRREPADPDILNRDQAAKLLGLHPETVARLARAGKLPAQKVGQQWRFSRRRLKSWIAGEE